MRSALRRMAGLVIPALVAVGLFGILSLTLLSAGSRADAGPGLVSARPGAAPTASVFRWQPPSQPGARGESSAPAAPDFRFDKKVMLRSDWDLNGCSGAVDSLTIYYSTTVAYCYFFTNVGTTIWVTHTLTDDKLGSTGQVVQNVPPNGQIGLAGIPPALLQDVTNTATWTSIDAGGVQLSRTDKVTVKVVIPLTGHVFIDQNGDGVRNPTETAGVAGVKVDLEPRPGDPALRRRATSFASGYYQFLDAVAGTYTVSIQLPAGYVATSPTALPVTLVFGVAKVANFGVRAATATPTPTGTPTPEVTPTPTDTATVTPTASPTVTEGPTPTATPTSDQSVTPTPTPTETPSSTPTVTPTRIEHVYLPLLVQLPPGLRPPLAPSLMPISSPGANVSYLISWTPIYGASGYEVEQGRDGAFTGVTALVYSGDKTSFEMPSNGIGTYYYRARARNWAGMSPWSEVYGVDLAWETEPNNILTEANDGLASGVTLNALPGDPNDFFRVTTTELGALTVRVDDMVGEGVRLALNYGNIGNLLVTDTTAPYELSTFGGPGDYYVRISVAAGYSTTSPYSLVVTYK